MRTRISSSDYDKLFLRDPKVRNAALQRALDIRKFEIDLYWRRATYFWTLIGASLLAYGAAQALTPSPSSRDLSVVASCLGFVFSCAWYFAIRGSKQWQENWENHVDLLEESGPGPLYAVILSRTPPGGPVQWAQRVMTGPGPYSVSKINQVVSVFVTLLWVILAARVLGPLSMTSPIHGWYLALVSISVGAVVAMGTLGRTRVGDQRLIATRRSTFIENEGKRTAEDMR